jgi:hypothetical protein
LKSSREGEWKSYSTGRKLRRVDTRAFNRGISKAGTDGGVAARRSVDFPWTVGSHRPAERLRMSVFHHS